MSENDDSEEQRAARAAAGAPERLQGKAPLSLLKGEAPFCSFCGKGRGEYQRLIKGPQVNICDACVSQAKQQIDRPQEANS